MRNKLIALGLGVVLAAVVLEVGVRLLQLAPPLPKEYQNFVADPYLAFRPKPNSSFQGRNATDEFDVDHTFNSMGFRDVEHDLEKPPGVFRILGLGDSFTVGVGAAYEDTYLARLEQLLNERPGVHPRVEIIKAGVAAYGAVEERLLLEHYGQRYQPDLVTVAFVDNDIMNAYHGVGHAQPDADGFLMSATAQRLGAPGRWLYLNSHAGRALLGLYLQRSRAAKEAGSWEEIYKANGRHEPDWQTVEGEYLRMREIARQAGAKFALIYIPQASLRGYPPSRLAAFAAENQIPFISTRPALREALQSGEQLYWKKDRHCTGAGYRVIAETLFQRLQELGLVP